MAEQENGPVNHPKRARRAADPSEPYRPRYAWDSEQGSSTHSARRFLDDSDSTNARSAERSSSPRYSASPNPNTQDNFFDVEREGLTEPEPQADDNLNQPLPGPYQPPVFDRSAGFKRTLLRTTIGTLIPGTGLLGTRKTLLGLVIFLISVIVAAVLIATGFIHLQTLITWFANSTSLMVLGVGLGLIAVLWVVLICGTYLISRPRRMTSTQRLVGAIVVFIMSALVATPTTVAAAYSIESSILIGNVFGNSNSKSQTRPSVSSGANPWAGRDRLNILLLGGDSGEGRDDGLGLRTDTLMLASIDIATGDTVIIQLPRNLENVPFPEGTALAEAYPNGRVWDGYSGSEDEYMLNAVWNEVPEEHPELFTDTDYPGADAAKLAVSGITGLSVDYFMMINIDGIQTLVDAMGGVTVNINFPIAKGGHVNGYGDEECGVDGYLNVGADQHLDGADAMWYARSRCNDPDYDYGRMRRQSCLVNAIINQADPTTMLTRYEAIAAASQNMMSTDIPEDLLDNVASLALKVKDGNVTRVVFSQDLSGTDTNGYSVNPGNPDYPQMREEVAAAIQASEDARNTASATSAQTSTQATSAPTEDETTEEPGYEETTETSTSATSEPTAENVTDACSYNPVS